MPNLLCLNQLILFNFSIKSDSLSNLTRLLKAPNYVLKSYKEKFQSISNNFNKEIRTIREKKFFILKNLSRIIKFPDNLVKLKKN